MQAYVKSLTPFLAAVLLVIVDKVLVNDSIPDDVWLTLFGAALVVWGVPNYPRNKTLYKE